MTDQATINSGEHDLLVELGCEELPPKELATLAEAFFTGTCDGLQAAGIGFDRDASGFFYTPRRMALSLSTVAARQPDREQERRGPSVAAAFDAQGKPTRAAEGFARSVGKAVAELERLATDKGEWLRCMVEVPGQALHEVLFPVLKEALDKLPVPKPMRWSDHDFSFVRPVHWLVVLHGEQVLPGSLFGCQAGRETRGHRIHAPGPHRLDHPGQYLDRLRKARVEGDQAVRKQRINELAAEQGRMAGGHTRITAALLDEVSNLVEWPVAVCCHFEEEYLGVPAEALIASMEGHQKFFPVLSDSEAALTPAFVVIANLESRDPAQMIAGFERVVRPRLADARFFWQQDLKQPLTEQASRLDRVVFQKDLGTIGDKSRRIAAVSKQLAVKVSADPVLAERAALLCKADLSSQMVGEFPELQGVMGAHHARADGEDEAVATAIASHYLPRFSGDEVPADAAGRLVAIADRLDTLVGVFAAGLKPTGNKDPFALRRASLGVIRILLEARLGLTLYELLQLAADALQSQVSVDADTLSEVQQFMLERLRHYFVEQGASTRQVAAVLAAPLGTLADAQQRLAAVGRFMGRTESESLVAANKRIGNILKKQEGGFSGQIDTGLFQLDEERELYAQIKQAQGNASEPAVELDYDAALARLATLREPVDAYFDKVMVMDDDPAIRANRLATLALLKAQFDGIADFAVGG
jgi:glycyl-tRNA synthetase beta chain